MRSRGKKEAEKADESPSPESEMRSDSMRWSRSVVLFLLFLLSSPRHRHNIHPDADVVSLSRDKKKEETTKERQTGCKQNSPSVTDILLTYSPVHRFLQPLTHHSRDVPNFRIFSTITIRHWTVMNAVHTVVSRR